MIGRKVIGNWGALFPHSRGEITKVEGTDVTIVWEDGGFSYTRVDQIKYGPVRAIGIYFAEGS